MSGGLDETTSLALLSHPDEDIRTWTVRLLGDENQVSAAAAERLAELARSDTSPVVRSQLACTAKRLSGEQGLPIVAALVAHDQDADDPHIPLLLWWAVEDKAAKDREHVLTMFATSAAWTHPISMSVILPRLAHRYAAVGQPEDFAACAAVGCSPCARQP